MIKIGSALRSEIEKCAIDNEFTNMVKKHRGFKTVTPKTSLISKNLSDDMDNTELVMDLEDSYGIDLGDEHQNATTVGKLYNLVNKKRMSKTAAPASWSETAALLEKIKKSPFAKGHVPLKFVPKGIQQPVSQATLGRDIKPAYKSISQQKAWSI